jgi:hypothetical protein
MSFCDGARPQDGCSCPLGHAAAVERQQIRTGFIDSRPSSGAITIAQEINQPNGAAL